MINHALVSVSVDPPLDGGVVWHNPETGVSAVRVDDPDGGTLWVHHVEKFTTYRGVVDSGFLLFGITHDLFMAQSSIWITKVLVNCFIADSHCQRIPVPVTPKVLDPGEVLKVTHWVGNDPWSGVSLMIFFREVVRRV